MSRLTTKNPDGKQLILKDGKVINHFSSLTDSWMICDKLGKLEDIEEELGCPLEVVFKAIKDRHIIVKHIIGVENPQIKYEKHRLVGLEFNTNEFIWNVYDNEHFYEEFVIKVKDYKKTWWLKGERDVKD